MNERHRQLAAGRSKWAAADALARCLISISPMFEQRSDAIVSPCIRLNAIRIVISTYRLSNPSTLGRIAGDDIYCILNSIGQDRIRSECRRIAEPFALLGYTLSAPIFTDPFLRAAERLSTSDAERLFECIARNRSANDRITNLRALTAGGHQEEGLDAVVILLNSFFDRMEVENAYWSVWRLALLSVVEGKTEPEGFVSALEELDKAAWRADVDAALASFWQMLAIKTYTPAVQREAQYDFFISYNESDEKYARFIGELLEASGFTIFAQYKDMLPGSNFIGKMNEGLSKSKRVIAILSRSYLKSPMCRSEWMAAFRTDPDSQQGVLVPLMVRPCKPDALLAPIVYSKLIGLSKQEAINGILVAVGCQGRSLAIDSIWPGELVDAVQEVHSDLHANTPQIHRLVRDAETGDIRFFDTNDDGERIAREAALQALSSARSRLAPRLASYWSSTSGERCSFTDRIFESLANQINRNSTDVEQFFEELLDARFDLLRMEENGTIQPIEGRFHVNRIYRAVERSIDSLTGAVPQLEKALEYSRRARITRPTAEQGEALDSVLDVSRSVLNEHVSDKLESFAREADFSIRTDTGVPMSEKEKFLHYQRGGYSLQIYRLSKEAAEEKQSGFQHDYADVTARVGASMRRVVKWMLDWHY